MTRPASIEELEAVAADVSSLGRATADRVDRIDDRIVTLNQRITLLNDGLGALANRIESLTRAFHDRTDQLA